MNVHVTRIKGSDIYGHTVDHCDSGGCSGDERFYGSTHASVSVGDIVELNELRPVVVASDDDIIRIADWIRLAAETALQLSTKENCPTCGAIPGYDDHLTGCAIRRLTEVGALARIVTATQRLDELQAHNDDCTRLLLAWRSSAVGGGYSADYRAAASKRDGALNLLLALDPPREG